MNIRQLAKKIWLKQVLLLFVIVALVTYFDQLLAKSILIGGLIFLIPSVYFGLTVFRSSSNQSKELALHNMYRGEVGKFLLTSVGFALVFVLFQPFNIMVLVLSFIVMTILNLIMLTRLD